MAGSFATSPPDAGPCQFRPGYALASRTAPEHPFGQTEREALVQVVVRDNNVDQALRALKKKMQREGIFREMKLRNYYEKPSEKRAREKAEAIRRARKLARKKAQREGGAGTGPAPKPRTPRRSF
jgi:small subunit ribosomal protein S21